MPKMWLWVEGKGETPDRQAGKGGAAAVLVRRILEEQYQDYGWQMDTLKVGHLDNFRSKTERYVNYLRKRNDIDALLVLLDLDDGCAAQVAQQVTEGLRKLNPPKPIAVVFAVREYEAWFLAAANSLWGRPYQDNPESIRDAKGELRRLFLEDYAPTTDQASLSARMDVREAEKNSRSFRRLVHAVEELRRAVSQGQVVVTP